MDVYAGLFTDNLEVVADRLDQAVASRNADQVRTASANRSLRHRVTIDQMLLTRDNALEPLWGIEPQT